MNNQITEGKWEVNDHPRNGLRIKSGNDTICILEEDRLEAAENAALIASAPQLAIENRELRVALTNCLNSIKSLQNNQFDEWDEQAIKNATELLNRINQ